MKASNIKQAVPVIVILQMICDDAADAFFVGLGPFVGGYIPEENY